MEKDNLLLGSNEKSVWKVLSVEDDSGYQSALINALNALNFGNREVVFLTATSAQEASVVIAQNPDIGVILLDVVMETDDAGLRLVHSIREGLGNHQVRIVLLTGQPGMAPLDDAMACYDIDDYWCKSDLTHDHLQTIVLSNLRTWEHLNTIQQARHGLQMLVESSQRISNKLELRQYTQAILMEIETLFGMRSGGIVCMAHRQDQKSGEAFVFAATGDYEEWLDLRVNELSLEPEVVDRLKLCLNEQNHFLDEKMSVLHFSSQQVDSRDYIVLVFHQRPLLAYQIELMKVFCETVNVGFQNVALHGRLAELAYYDTSTNLHNKNWLSRQIAGLTPIERDNCKLLMLFVEELAYSEVLFGVQFGRDLMALLHQHLKSKLPGTIDIALYERDTLVLLIHDSSNYTAEMIEPLLHARLWIVDQYHSIDLKASVVNLKDTVGMAPPQILGVAKSLLEQVKHDDTGLEVFGPRVLVQMQTQYQMLKDLREALLNDEISIHLQPKLRLSDQRLVGFEVLARWQHKNGNMIPPDQFIKVAETSGLIDRLDRIVARLACQAAKRLESQNIRVPLSINAAGSELSRSDYVDSFVALLAEEEVALEQLDIEVTETQLINEQKALFKHLKRFKKLGVRVSIDDFGSGYSSLAYLSTLDTQVLKIDRQFVARMFQTDQDRKILQTIIDLGHTFNMEVLAEGIETQAQLEQLIEMGCDSGQGYLMARPMPLEDAISWHRSRQVS